MGGLGVDGRFMGQMGRQRDNWEDGWMTEWIKRIKTELRAMVITYLQMQGFQFY